MGESLDIDSPFRGWAMPRSYSGDLQERVIEAVEMEGASRREAAERFDISVSSAVKWLQRWSPSRSAAPKPRGGSVSPLEAHAERILALVAERPDLTLKETLVELLKRRIRTSKSALSRFFARHDITFKKSLQAAERERAEVARARRRWIREQGMLDCPIPGTQTLAFRPREVDEVAPCDDIDSAVTQSTTSRSTWCGVPNTASGC
jgi:transposase